MLVIAFLPTFWHNKFTDLINKTVYNIQYLDAIPIFESSISWRSTSSQISLLTSRWLLMLVICWRKACSISVVETYCTDPFFMWNMKVWTVLPKYVDESSASSWILFPRCFSVETSPVSAVLTASRLYLTMSPSPCECFLLCLKELHSPSSSILLIDTESSSGNGGSKKLSDEFREESDLDFVKVVPEIGSCSSIHETLWGTIVCLFSRSFRRMLYLSLEPSPGFCSRVNWSLLDPLRVSLTTDFLRSAEFCKSSWASPLSFFVVCWLINVSRSSLLGASWVFECSSVSLWVWPFISTE